MIELPEGRSLELTQELLKGGIDVHVHPGRDSMLEMPSEVYFPSHISMDHETA